jgi:hypothetical protein
LGTTVTAYGYTCTGKALISSNMISFTGDIGEFDFEPVHIDEAFIDIYIYSGRKAEFSTGGSATIQGITLTCKVRFEKYNGVLNCVLYGALAGEDLRFARVLPEADGTFLDTLHFSKAALLLQQKIVRPRTPIIPLLSVKGLSLWLFLKKSRYFLN